jgi:hypothetical protein
MTGINALAEEAIRACRARMEAGSPGDLDYQ